GQSAAGSITSCRDVNNQAVFVLNQAPARRLGLEAPAVLQAGRALQDLGYPVAPVGLRSRTAYQQGAPSG
ncbi:MAG: ParA family protein, partial [Pseudomonadota bacterium]